MAPDVSLCISLAGHRFWDNYCLSLEEPSSKGKVGLERSPVLSAAASASGILAALEAVLSWTGASSFLPASSPTPTSESLAMLT